MSAGNANAFLETIQNRRTIYTISKASTIPDSRIQEIVQQGILHTPSSFNSQSSRAVLLLGKHHTTFWNDITLPILKAIVPEEAFAATKARIGGFEAGYGTVLFFEDQKSVEVMQQKFAAYQDRFPIWSQHSSGMLQHIVWTALEKEGLGASLQHYNPLIDEKVKAEWGIPESWQLVSQMPFGTPTAPAGEKTFAPIEERFKVFAA